MFETPTREGCFIQWAKHNSLAFFKMENTDLAQKPTNQNAVVFNDMKINGLRYPILKLSFSYKTKKTHAKKKKSVM
jgi:hypothetical protein